MYFQEKLQQLINSSGEHSALIMKELGSFIAKASSSKRKEITCFCLDVFDDASEKRQGSLAFLIALCAVDTSLISQHLNSDSPIIREQTVKGLLRITDESFVSLLAKRLDEEPLYRIKKWILYALANSNSVSAQDILSTYIPEKELFSDYQKIIAKQGVKQKNPSLNSYEELFEKTLPLIIKTVSGLEDEWLKLSSMKGTVLGNGYVKLEKHASIRDFMYRRDVYGVGIDVGSVLDIEQTIDYLCLKPHFYSIHYTNDIEREKQQLSSLQFILHKKEWMYNKESILCLQFYNSDSILLFVKTETQSYPYYHTAGINSVVASLLSHIALSKITVSSSLVVVDQCCGAGTLLIETNQQLCQLVKDKTNELVHWNLLGFDIDKEMAQATKLNGFAFNTKIDFRKLDGRTTKLQSDSVSLIMSNLPFDNRVKEDDVEQLYLDLLTEAKRIILSKGLLIYYTVQKKAIRNAITTLGLKLIDEKKLYLAKIEPSIFIIQKR